jgi:hypothetical protein
MNIEDVVGDSAARRDRVAHPSRIRPPKAVAAWLVPPRPQIVQCQCRQAWDSLGARVALATR